MESSIHTLGDLFLQLGLPDDQTAIDAFVAQHRPMPAGMALAAAPFWSVSQAQLLHEKLCDDADWAEVVDGLSLLLRA